MNPVTGRVEPMFSDRERFVRYVISFFICLPPFIFVFIVIVVFLNLTGIIDPSKHGGLFHMHTFCSLSYEGALFDVNTNWAFIPSILQSVVTLIMNLIFKQIAIIATD